MAIDPLWLDEKQVQLDVHAVCTWAIAALQRIPHFVVPADIAAIMEKYLAWSHAVGDDDVARVNVCDSINVTTEAEAPTVP